jgi:hypothetical protein
VGDGVDHLRRHARHFFLALDASRSTREERVRLTSDALSAVGTLGADVAGTLDGLEATLLLI